MLKENYQQIDIAKAIGRHKSVVCREIKRNCDKRNGSYNHDLAQRKYEKRNKGKPKKIRFTDEKKQLIVKLLEDKYSPEQISGYCKRNGIDMVSHERIYQYIWQDKKQGGKLYIHLRTRGKRYRKRGNMKDSRGIIKDRVCISKRPQIVGEKQRFGDLEIDTIIGKDHKGAILTINDRATGLLKMKKVNSRSAEEVKEATIELLKPLKPFLHTITGDNGKEFALHQDIAKELNIDFYFARPYHSWESGANENLNGLIRQYIPKKADLEQYTFKQIQWIEQQINQRSRKRFNFASPFEMFNQKVAFVT